MGNGQHHQLRAVRWRTGWRGRCLLRQRRAIGGNRILLNMETLLTVDQHRRHRCAPGLSA
jgi:hypothetical protein